MLVSWNWLQDYVDLGMPREELEHRLAMSGLNHEGTEPVGDDVAIDLEVTSNRPDCLGHIGVAREIAVLYEQPLRFGDPRPPEASTPAGELTRVEIQCPELCFRYSARVIRGVNVGPSPAWLVDRLTTLGIKPINNVVDVTNYVLMECAQPLHAFDFARLAERRIVVREAHPGEEFTAIDHKTYPLEPGMCVIADAENAVALGGVMGGAESEVSDATTDLLLEAAEFDPLSIRNTARKLRLHSDSSYRFERGIDPEGVDWASRRACELILDLAGGELVAGVVDVGREQPRRPQIVLRLSQLKRILGIDIAPEEVRRILTALGGRELDFSTERIQIEPPSWRRDLHREVDLVEEVARIHGYDEISEDVAVRIVPSHKRDQDRVADRVRHAMTALGFDEVLTASVVSQRWSEAFSPWTTAEPFVTNTPMLKGADRLRRSLVPSLLGVRRENEAAGSVVAELFETAKVYLPTGDEHHDEPWMLGIVSGGGFFELKGVIETLVAEVAKDIPLTADAAELPLLDAERGCRLALDGEPFGVLGEVSQEGLEAFGLRTPCSVAELRLDNLVGRAVLVPRHAERSPFPETSRDVNLIVEETVRWADLAATIRASGGELLEELTYLETFRDAERDGPGKKRLLFSFTLRAPDRTLTGEEADAVREAIVTACAQEHGAQLVG